MQPLAHSKLLPVEATTLACAHSYRPLGPHPLRASQGSFILCYSAKIGIVEPVERNHRRLGSAVPLTVWDRVFLAIIMGFSFPWTRWEEPPVPDWESAMLLGQVEAQSRETTALKKLEYEMQRKIRAQQSEITALKRFERRGRPRTQRGRDSSPPILVSNPSSDRQRVPVAAVTSGRGRVNTVSVTGASNAATYSIRPVATPSHRLAAPENRVPWAMNRLIAEAFVASLLALWLLPMVLPWIFHYVLRCLKWRDQQSKEQ